MLEFIEDAKSKGAEVIFGGQKVKRPGFFLQPTVLANVTNDMACQNEEIFGPILPIRAFDDENEAFELANKSEHGLSAYVYTGSLSTALKAQEDIMCGNVCINGAHYSIELPHGGKYYIDYLKRPIFAKIKIRIRISIGRVMFWQKLNFNQVE